MTAIRSRIHVRLESALLRAGLFACTAIAVVLGGCAMGQDERMTLGDGPHTYGGGWAAGGSEAVFASPEAAALTSAYGAESFPEYARLDGRMNIASSAPMMATSQWPQAPLPDATNVYVSYLPLINSSSYQPVAVYQQQGTYNPRSSWAWRQRWW